MIDQKTSVELSKKLKEAGCDLPTKWYWIKISNDPECDEWELYEYKKEVDPALNNAIIKAYDLLWDVCVRYIEEFFGDTILAGETVLNLLQAEINGERGIIENYIWQYCKFNKEDKK